VKEAVLVRKKGWLRIKYDVSCAAVDRFCEKNAGLRAAAVAHGGWLSKMLGEICWNQVRGDLARVDKGLEELTADDGMRIGRSYAKTILSTNSSEGAADELIKLYPALGEMDQLYCTPGSVPYWRPRRSRRASRESWGCIGGRDWAQFCLQPT
jgi:hypothetical protein